MSTATTIESVTVTRFATTTRVWKDEEGHDHPGEVDIPSTATLLTIRDSDGDEGYYVSPGGEYLRDSVIDHYVRPNLVGKDPLRREQIWNLLYLAQRGAYGHLHDRTLSFVEQALWDLAGRKFGQPVWKLAGGFRDSVPAYASTMCGDEVPGGLSSPEDYAAFAVQLVAQGYTGIKLHTWMPPVSFSPDAKMDVKACAAVREAVGPDITLMLDCYHWYNRSDALYIGTEVGKLGYAWMEEPMDEYSMSSYKWLVDQIDLPVSGPESVEGKFRARAEWAASGAVDLLRIGVNSAGGITPALKVCALAESFGMDCEIHGGGTGGLALTAAAPNGRWYERGLLHPHLDFEVPPPHLNSIIDPIDGKGIVHMPDRPGLGEDINFEYIAAKRGRMTRPDLDAVVAASRMLAATTPPERAALLRRIADALAAATDDLVPIAMAETGLGRDRLAGEVARTVGQFRLYADAVEEGSWLGASITHASATSTPPIDDHRRLNVPLGPVLVFAASNFPFAFGIAGTDTASAMAAGCAVVVKGHPGHPRLAARLVEVVSAVTDAFVPGLFVLVERADAVEVLRDPRVEAGAFTGSIGGGTALLEIAQRRERPIPFYAEMGSVNPVVVTAAAWAARKEQILDGLLGSMSLSNGQLCTSPGLLFVPGNIDVADLTARLAGATAAPMLTDAITDGFRSGLSQLSATAGVTAAGPVVVGDREAAPVVWLTDAAAIATSPGILDERFGPSSVVVDYQDHAQLAATIAVMDGQLTASIFSEPGEDVSELVQLLSRKVGRVLSNAWPTGVAVTWSMHHGGPWPASSSAAYGSVGTEAINRFLRPLAYQNFEDAALPPALREANPWGIPRRVDGVLSA